MGTFNAFEAKYKLRDVFSPYARITPADTLAGPAGIDASSAMEMLLSMKTKLYKDVLNGGYIAHGDIDFSKRDMDWLPDMSQIKVDGTVDLRGNKLENLYGAPKEFAKLHSDFGSFSSWAEVPGALKQPSEKQLAEEKAAAEAKAKFAAERKSKTLVGRFLSKLGA